MRAIKVLRRLNGSLWSAMDTCAAMEYVEGERNTPEIGRVFMFMEMKNAARFANSRAFWPHTLAYEAWEVECSKVHTVFHVMTTDFSKLDLTWWWGEQRGDQEGLKEIWWFPSPPGTHSTEWVELVRCLEVVT